MKPKLIIPLMMFICFTAGIVCGQTNGPGLNVDEQFAIAREKIFHGDREEGRKILASILTVNPEYDEVRILLARSYAWDGKRERARNELILVLSQRPGVEAAINALYDVEIWDEHYEDALTVANNGLAYYPSSVSLLFKKASVLDKLNRQQMALAVLNALLSVDPVHGEGHLLYEKIQLSRMKYTAGASYGIDFFSRTFDHAQYSSVQLSRSDSWGSSILRFNQSSRFSSHGLQGEMDLYPKITKGMYAYINYGYSSSSLFPRHRFGGEVHTKLPAAFEASGGIRYLYFGSDNKVLIYTGSVGYYFKNYWLSYRPYITPDKTRTSFSSSLTIRRYFEDSDNYVSLNGNFGFSPDERRIQNGTGLTDDGIYTLKSQNLGASWQKTLRKTFIVNLSYTIIHQELSFDAGQYVWINSATVGLKKKF